ncbi:MAG: hypothetical protein HWN65_14145 [Candidatus Helarchaeota archaeon]|nr:hypothetical protein [Candidatus Helarchaeota archaeon]
MKIHKYIIIKNNPIPLEALFTVKKGRQLGGFCAIAAGIIPMIMITNHIIYVLSRDIWNPLQYIVIIITPTLGVMSVIGGFLLLKDNKWGALLVLCAAALLLIGRQIVVAWYPVNRWLELHSVVRFVGSAFVPLAGHKIIDPVLMINAGVLGLAFGSKS